MSRRIVDILAIAAIWVLALSGAVLIAAFPDDDPTTDEVGVAVTLAGVVGFILTGLYLGVRRRRLVPYTTGFVTLALVRGAIDFLVPMVVAGTGIAWLAIEI